MKNICIYLFLFLFGATSLRAQQSCYNQVIVEVSNQSSTLNIDFSPSGTVVKEGVVVSVFDNLGQGMSDLEISKGSAGWIAISDYPTDVVFDFAQVGVHTILFRALYDDGDPSNTPKYSYGEIDLNVKEGALAGGNQTSSGYMSPDAAYDITGEEFSPPVSSGSFPNPDDLVASQGSGRMYVKYAYNNGTGGLVKPIIFLDGYDPSTNVVCDPNFTGGAGDRTIRYGSIGWDVLVTGVSPDEYNDDPLAEAPLMLNDMLSDGFDIVFVDFADGADWIQKNGLVFEKALEKVNELKEQNGSSFDNIVVGNSMGGQIARWALLDMEAKGINHCVGLTVYNDSPHQGANIPLSIQGFAWFSAFYGENPNPKFWNSLLRPAPQQLLKTHFNSALPNTNTQSLHDGFYNGLGYPKKCKNVALAYGSGTGLTQFSADTKLFHADVWSGSLAEYGFDLRLWASDRTNHSPNPETDNLIAYCKIFTLKYNAVSPLFHYLHVYRTGTNSIGIQVSSNAGVAQPLKHYDHTFDSSLDFLDRAPGNQRKDVSRALFNGLKSQLPSDAYVEAFVESTTFMPMISLLDIPTNDLLFDVKNNIDQEDPDNTLTPFAKVYYVDGSNLDHVQITEEIRNWVKNRIPEQGKILQASSLFEKYNYANFDQSNIPNVIVEDGGELCVNSKGFAGFADNSLSNDGEAVFARRLTSCGTNITVNQGGRFVMGEGWSNSGVVNVEAGATVHIKNGGTLHLFNQSKLQIQEGATLILDPGARIILTDPDSKIEIEGTLQLNGQPEFSGAGYWHFKEGNELVFGPDMNLWRVQGVGKGNRMMKLSADVFVPHGKSIDLRLGRVEYENATLFVRTGGHASGVSTEFEALNGFTGAVNAYYAGDVQFIGCCSFKRFGTAVQAEFTPFARFIQCSFEETTTGIYHLCPDGTAEISSCTFMASPNHFDHVRRVNIGGSTFKGTRYDVFPSSTFGVPYASYGAVSLANVALCHVGNSTFEDNNVGLAFGTLFITDGQSRPSNVVMYKTKFVNNEIGVYGLGDASTGLVQATCCQFLNNKWGIAGQDIHLAVRGDANSPDPTDATANLFSLGGNLNSSARKYVHVCYSSFDPETDGSNLLTGNDWLGDQTPQDHIIVGARNNCSRDVSVVSQGTGCGFEAPTDPDKYVEWVGGYGGTDCEVIVNSEDHVFIHMEFIQGELYYVLLNNPTIGLDHLIRLSDMYHTTSFYTMPANCRYYISTAHRLVSALGNDGGGENIGLVKGDAQQPQQGSAKVFPNPTSDYVNIVLSEENTSDVLLYDGFGKMVRQLDAQQGVITLQTLDLPSGLYSIEIREAGKRPVREKVMVQRL